jgi:hypothetical protein
MIYDALPSVIVFDLVIDGVILGHQVSQVGAFRLLLLGLEVALRARQLDRAGHASCQIRLLVQNRIRRRGRDRAALLFLLQLDLGVRVAEIVVDLLPTTSTRCLRPGPSFERALELENVFGDRLAHAGDLVGSPGTQMSAEL